MGNRNNTLTAVPIGGLSRIDNIKQDVDMGTVRVNYTFGGPVVAKLLIASREHLLCEKAGLAPAFLFV